MNIFVSNRCYLSEFSAEDQEDLVKYLQDSKIHANTLTIPYPYTEQHAAKFIESKQDSKLDFAIRNHAGMLIGCVGARQDAQAHSVAIGYWLAKPYWNKGIMSEVVRQFTNFLFKEYTYVRVTASCFATNIASARVLQKAGFNLEGEMRKYYHKHGKFHDGKLFAKVRLGT